MTEQQATRAGFYPRVSRRNARNDEALERHTLAEQRSLAEGFLPRGVELVDDERYRDVNVSGRNSERPGLQAIFDDVRAGVIDAVVVGYLSRFGRNAREALDNLKQLHELGATLYIAKESLIAPPGTRGVGKMLYTILAAVAEMEGDRLADGLALANATARADGVSIQVPYGYKRSNGPGSVLELDERDDFGSSPASVVRRVFELARDGEGASAIARRLSDEGVPTPTQLRYLRGERDKTGAQRWQHNAIGGILETRTYRGVLPVGVAFEGEGKRRRAIAWEERPAQHPPLISDELWHAAQLSSRPAVRNGSTGGSLLQGLVRCAGCSQTMRPSKAGGDSRDTLTYKCRGRAGGCDQPATITRRLVDAYVVEQLLEGATEAHELDESKRAELTSLVELVERAERELEAYVSTASALDEGDFVKGYSMRKSERDVLRERERVLREQTPDRRERIAQLHELPLDARREVLRESLDAVVVKRGRGLAVSERVVLIDRGLAPFELSGTGRNVAPRRWPL
jgi:DNA invertase Pin-like site-specific DNA recombinase